MASHEDSDVAPEGVASNSDCVATANYGAPAWGKVILLGEHAVVYGHKAIAGAIHLGLRCKESPTEVARLTVPAWDIDVSAGDENAVALAFTALHQEAGREPVHIEMEASLPPAAGLGSSAALCVALARILQPKLRGHELHAFANMGESFFHKNPSGIDVALSEGGGMGAYTKRGGLVPISCAPLPLVVGLSGVARSTAKMVDGVAQRLQKDPSSSQDLSKIAELAEAGEKALVAGDLALLGTLMKSNHQLLQKIGVSISVLDQMVEAAMGAGALGAKLTGAGGGGAMIALAPGRQEQVAAALRALGHEAFITTLGAAA